MLKDIVNADHWDVVGNKAGNTYKSFIWMSMQVDKAGDRKSPLLDLSAQVVISTSLVQIQPYPFIMGRWAELVTQRTVNPWLRHSWFESRAAHHKLNIIRCCSLCVLQKQMKVMKQLSGVWWTALFIYAWVAHTRSERWSEKPQVVGSTPTPGTIWGTTSKSGALI